MDGDKMVETNHWSDDGDSGGPVYHYDGSYAYICGIHGYGTTDNDDGDPSIGSLSTSIVAVEDRFNLTV